MTAATTTRRLRRPYRPSGTYALKRALKARGLAALDQRSSLARRITAWRGAYVADLGGALTTAEEALLDRAAVRLCVVLTIEEALAQGPAWIINRRRRQLTRLAREHAQLCAGFEAALERLGLKRRARPVVDLAGLLAPPQRATPAPGNGDGAAATIAPASAAVDAQAGAREAGAAALDVGAEAEAQAGGAEEREP